MFNVTHVRMAPALYRLCLLECMGEPVAQPSIFPEDACQRFGKAQQTTIITTLKAAKHSLNFFFYLLTSLPERAFT